MKRIKKHISEKASKDCALDLANYRQSPLDKGALNMSNLNYAPLGRLFTLAAFALGAPLMSNGQCVLNSQSVDVNRDGVPDLYIYSTFRTNGYAGAIRSVFQIRARAAGSSNSVAFFGTQFFPRSCYYNNCVFPTPDGATTGVQMGNVAVLRESINSCQISYVMTSSCFTYTTTYGTVTSCNPVTYTTTNCNPTIINGNFEFGQPGTLAFKLNNQEFHFIELTLGIGQLYQKIDGATAAPCDIGCQDSLELIGNQIFPIDGYYADEVIVTDDIVDTSQMVELRAGSSVELLQGFEVLSGGELTIEIDTVCN